MSGRVQPCLRRSVDQQERRTERWVIANERQYRVTQEQAERFERALERVSRRPIDPAEDALLRELEVAALQGQLNDLRAQVAEYEAWVVAQGTCDRSAPGPRAR